MEYPVEFWWVPLIAGGIGAFLAPIIGYLRNKRGEATQATIHGATVIDSSVGREVAVELRRMAIAAEGILEQIEKTAKAEDLRSVAADVMRDELARLRQNAKD